MFKIIFGFIFMSTIIFSAQELEFQVKKIDNKNIEILVTESSETKIQIYKIKYGDTLSELVLKLKNNMNTLIKLNNIKNRDLIITGENLKYIKKGDKNED